MPITTPCHDLSSITASNGVTYRVRFTKTRRGVRAVTPDYIADGELLKAHGADCESAYKALERLLHQALFLSLKRRFGEFAR